MDSAKLTDAYEAHRDSLVAYVTSLTRDRDDALDVVHEAYARLAEQARAGRAPSEIRGWLYRVGRNLVISRGRRQQVAARVMPRLRDGSVAASAEEICLAAEGRERLRRALAGVGSADRTALIMAAAGYTGAEIAAELGVSHGAVRTRQSRARARLRAQLAEAV